MTATLTSQHPAPLQLVIAEAAAGQSCSSLSALTHDMREGNDAAWTEFHGHYYLSLLRYASTCSARPDDAGEVVQLAYLRIARHIKPFTDEGALWRWLSCVVRCAAVDHQRGIRRRSALLEKFAHWQESQRTPTSSPVAPTDALAQEALGKLAAEDAQLLRLKYYEGWSVEQLATAANATPKAIENRLARLRHRLREIIQRIQ